MSSAAAFRPCAVVPCYDNPITVRPTVLGIRDHGLHVILVDDGSAPPCADVCQDLARDPGVTLVRRDQNGGKGVAVGDGFRTAAEANFTHAFQIDGDGQHDLDRIPAFLAAAAERPDALVLGYPQYEADAPRSRRFARGFTTLWVALETGRRAHVRDAMIGFRVYPLTAARAAVVRGRRMQFDIEILVQMVRARTPVVNLPVGVRYLTAEQGGVSHFRMVRDNWDFTCLHARLCTQGAFAWIATRLAGGGENSHAARADGGVTDGGAR